MTEFFKTSKLTREELEHSWEERCADLLTMAEENAFLTASVKQLRAEIERKDRLIQEFKNR